MNVCKKMVSIVLSIVLLASVVCTNVITLADSESVQYGLNLKVNGGPDRTHAALALPIAVGDYVEFSFEMKLQSGQTPAFLYSNNWGNTSINPVKVEEYRYTFNFTRTNAGGTGSVVRWFFDFTNKTSDVVISNMELYKTDSNYENKEGTNLLAGVYGENGDFDGWSLTDNYVSAWNNLVAGKVLFRSADTLYASVGERFAGSSVVTKPADYFVIKQYGLNLKVNGGPDRTHAALALPIAVGDYVEFSFDMKLQSGQTPAFLYSNNWGNTSINPVKIEGYRYTFNFTRTNAGGTGSVVRWFFDFTNKTSDAVISNMELYKTDSNYENKEGTNLLAGVYGINGDFDGWSLTDNYVSAWNNLVAGKVLFRSADTLYASVGERFAGTDVTGKPLDYFIPKQCGLNLVVNGGPDRTHAVLALPIAVGDYVELSFDMLVNEGKTPKFLYSSNWTNVSIDPVKIEGYRYTFNFTRTNTGNTGSVVRWFFDFTGISSNVLISNLELYKTDSNYENKEATNLLAGVYGANGDFDGWSVTDNRVSAWNNLAAGKIICRSAEDLNNSNRFPGIAVLTKPTDCFSVIENDVNLDKLIDYGDFSDLLNYLLDLEEKYLNVDINKDGSNDVKDLVHLAVNAGSRIGTYNRYEDFIRYRGQKLENTYTKLKNKEPINVIYMGGSVTDGVGSSDYSSCWRALTAKWFTDNYGELVNNISIAQSGTGTVFGSYRYNEQVAKNNPDVLFIEFSINDKYDEITVEEAKRGFETIVRQTRTNFPTCDIVAVFVTDQPERDPYTLPRYATAHDEICELYGISSIDVGGALLRHLRDTDGKWEDYVTDTCHPADSGYIVYAGAVKEYLENCITNGNYVGEIKEHTIPEMYSDSLLDGDIHYIDATPEMLEFSEANGGSGWYYQETSGYPSQIYGDVLMPSTANCKFVIEFTGTELAMVVYGGATNVNATGYNVTVDGVNSYVDHGKYQPRILATGLTPGKHTVEIEPVFSNNDAPYMMISGFFTRDETKITTKN